VLSSPCRLAPWRPAQLRPRIEVRQLASTGSLPAPLFVGSRPTQVQRCRMADQALTMRVMSISCGQRTVRQSVSAQRGNVAILIMATQRRTRRNRSRTRSPQATDDHHGRRQVTESSTAEQLLARTGGKKPKFPVTAIRLAGQLDRLTRVATHHHPRPVMIIRDQPACLPRNPTR
jgi:hypothetical protein